MIRTFPRLPLTHHNPERNAPKGLAFFHERSGRLAVSTRSRDNGHVSTRPRVRGRDSEKSRTTRPQRPFSCRRADPSFSLASTRASLRCPFRNPQVRRCRLTCTDAIAAVGSGPVRWFVELGRLHPNGPVSPAGLRYSRPCFHRSIRRSSDFGRAPASAFGSEDPRVFTRMHRKP